VGSARMQHYHRQIGRGTTKLKNRSVTQSEDLILKLWPPKEGSIFSRTGTYHHHHQSPNGNNHSHRHRRNHNRYHLHYRRRLLSYHPPATHPMPFPSGASHRTAGREGTGGSTPGSPRPGLCRKEQGGDGGVGPTPPFENEGVGWRMWRTVGWRCGLSRTSLPTACSRRSASPASGLVMAQAGVETHAYNVE